MAYGYPSYYPQPFYPAPVPDQLAQLRQGQYQQPQPMQPPPAQPSSGGNCIVWVPGQQAAYEYPLAPNTAVALWDSTAPVIYLKQADASGKPTTKVYDLVERVNAANTPLQPQTATGVEYATKRDLEALAARVEALSAKESAPAKTKKTAREEEQ